MNDGAVLDIRAGPDSDPMHVSPEHTVHPHTAVLADADVANHLCALVYERRGSHLRETIPVGPKHLSKLYAEPDIPPHDETPWSDIIGGWW